MQIALGSKFGDCQDFPVSQRLARWSSLVGYCADNPDYSHDPRSKSRIPHTVIPKELFRRHRNGAIWVGEESESELLCEHFSPDVPSRYMTFFPFLMLDVLVNIFDSSFGFFFLACFKFRPNSAPYTPYDPILWFKRVDLTTGYNIGVKLTFWL